MEILDFSTMEISHPGDDTAVPVVADNEVRELLAGRYPLTHYWDDQEPKMLVCEAARVAPASKDDEGGDNVKQQVLNVG